MCGAPCICNLLCRRTILTIFWTFLSSTLLCQVWMKNLKDSQVTTFQARIQTREIAQIFKVRDEMSLSPGLKSIAWRPEKTVGTTGTEKRYCRCATWKTGWQCMYNPQSLHASVRNLVYANFQWYPSVRRQESDAFQSSHCAVSELRLMSIKFAKVELEMWFTLIWQQL